MSYIPSERLAELASIAEEVNEASQDAAIIDAFALQHARTDSAYAAYAAEVRKLDSMIEADTVEVAYSPQYDAKVVRFTLAGGMVMEAPVKARG